MLTRTTRDAAAAYALSLAGKSRDHLPVPWTASPAMDDCAAFCSHVLWGGKPGPVIWVDGFKTAGDGTYAGGATDLQPWDVLLFDWEGNGVGNHVEFYVRDLGGGFVQTYGANGSDSREARYRTRPKRYIMGRFRPTWGAAGALIDHITTAATVAGEEDDMSAIAIVGIETSPRKEENALWVVDFGAKTKWNAAAGGLDPKGAIDVRVHTMLAMGVKRYDRQAPQLLAGFTDITKR